MELIQSNTDMEDPQKTQETGMVKWFCDKRGYGFLKGYNLNRDIFAHHSEIVTNDEFKNLRKGQEVTFELEFDASQIKAKHIRILS
jgi:CspA family cold shock protein